MPHLVSSRRPLAAGMPTSTLAQLARLLPPAHRLAWRWVAHSPGQLLLPQPRLGRDICCSAAAQLDPAAPPPQTAGLEQEGGASKEGEGGAAFAALGATVTAAKGAAAAGSEAPAGVASAVGPQGSQASRTGAFQRLPMVSPAKELLDSALRRAARVGANKKLKNEAQKAKNRAARQLDTLLKELCVPLGRYVKEFPPQGRLHPFERALLELTVGPGTYERVLGRVEALRKSTVQVGKAYAARCSKALNKKDAEALQTEGFERMEAVFSKGAVAVDELKEVAKTLRRLPVVHPELPTVALVGAPNVGKSSLVQLLSSGLPEVQNYPFTTRSIKMGHFYVDGRRHQVTDTPGLLNRKDEERNAMEQLTLASLQHLPTAVLFVADLTGECGTSVANQWQIRQDLKAKFPGKPWVDVLSKADMLEEEFDAADELAAQRGQQDEKQGGQAQQQQGDSPPAAGSVSSSSSGGGSGNGDGGPPAQGGGPEHLPAAAVVASVAGPPAAELGGTFNSLAAAEAAVAAGLAPAGAAGAARAGAVATAVDFAAALPQALRVSSLTGDGIEELKAAMLEMLEGAQLARGGVEGWWDEGEEGEAGEGLEELLFHADEEHREHQTYMYD